MHEPSQLKFMRRLWGFCEFCAGSTSGRESGLVTQSWCRQLRQSHQQLPGQDPRTRVLLSHSCRSLVVRIAPTLPESARAHLRSTGCDAQFAGTTPVRSHAEATLVFSHVMCEMIRLSCTPHPCFPTCWMVGVVAWLRLAMPCPYEARKAGSCRIGLGLALMEAPS